jgi:Ca-activated chloride channel family protein
MSSRRNFLAILAACGAVGAAIWGFGMKEGGLPSLTGIVSGDPVRISVASAVTKQAWLKAAVDDFAAAGITTAGGRPIEIATSNVLSGDSMLRIAQGELQPTVWSPGEFTWVEQLTERWNRQNGRPAMTEACKPTVLTPVGLAMWKPMAEALGWPEKPVSLKALVDLASDPQGWAAYGHPEWGRLKLGHTHPQYSSAGLLFLAQAIYAIAGKTEGITTDDIYDSRVEGALRTLEDNTSKYGMVTTDLLTNMARGGPAFLHATSAFEEGTVRFNVERQAELRFPLAFLFPAEGTFWSDQPYCILDGTSWVTPEQAEAARLFRDFLLSPAMQKRAGEFFVRPLDASVPLGSMLTVANGTDPSASPATVPDLEIPSPEISEAIIDQFMTTKRKATVLLVIDTSGSMEGDFIKTATQSTAEFLSRLHPQDRVGLMTFSDRVASVEPFSDVSKVAERMRGKVLGLLADGGTNLYGAVCQATKTIAETQARDRAAGENRLYGIVLLSDGEDTVGEISDTRLFQTCLDKREGGEGPKFFVVSLGDNVPVEFLNRLAAETNGAVFKADPASIGQAYLRISAEQ